MIRANLTTYILSTYILAYPDLDEKFRRMSLIHINFDEKQFWTVTKDAKTTIPDMIGNIGGTLGQHSDICKF